MRDFRPAVSLPERLKTMGIPRPRLQDGFGNPRDPYISAIDYYRDYQLPQVLALLERDGSPLGNVRSVVRFFEDLAADAHGCVVVEAFVKMCPHDAEIASVLHETLERLRKRIERSLHEAHVRGELAQEKSPQRLSRAVTNALIGHAVTGYTGTLSMLD